MKNLDGESLLIIFVLSICGLIGVALGGLYLWAWMANESLSSNPMAVILAVVQGDLVVPWQGWTTIAALFVVLGAVVVGGVRMVRKNARLGRRGDDKAALTGLRKDIEPLLEETNRAKAQRLGVTDAFGFPIACTVKSQIMLWSSVEDVTLTLAGPRSGKTTAWVVPRILAAPGAVVATSNKRDIVDATRYAREELTGERTWVYDPQDITGLGRTWYWNPLSYVTDFVSAKALATIFADAADDDGENKKNDFWVSAAKDHIAGLLLAAARGNYPLVRLQKWLTDVNDDEPVTLLKQHGDVHPAQTVQANLQLVAETRDGIMKNAVQLMSFMLNESAMQWTVPGDGAVEFNPAEFVRSNQTLYCMSEEGPRSASAITAALTIAVTEAAVEYAKTLRGGRLSRPMLICLDEAANVCRWRALPNQYSHFGSRGIMVDTIIQSWAQAVVVWGEAGIKKLWSAANVRVYLGGGSDKDFLPLLSDLIGSYYVDQINISTSKQGTSRSRTIESAQRPIATVADLAALPGGRAWVFASGSTPVLCRTIPWWEGPHKTLVEKSIASIEGNIS